MIGLKQICALFAAASLGAGGATVVHHRLAPKRVAASKPAAAVIKRPASRATPIPAPVCPPVAILDCPTSSLGGGDLSYFETPVLSPSLPSAGLPAWSNPPAGGGWVFTPVGPPAPDVVPEPAAWAMLVAGFGLVGVSMRRGRVA